MSEYPLGFAAGDENVRRYVSGKVIDNTDVTGLQEYLSVPSNLLPENISSVQLAQFRVPHLRELELFMGDLRTPLMLRDPAATIPTKIFIPKFDIPMALPPDGSKLQLDKIIIKQENATLEIKPVPALPPIDYRELLKGKLPDIRELIPKEPIKALEFKHEYKY